MRSRLNSLCPFQSCPWVFNPECCTYFRAEARLLEKKTSKTSTSLPCRRFSLRFPKRARYCSSFSLKPATLGLACKNLFCVCTLLHAYLYKTELFVTREYSLFSSIELRECSVLTTIMHHRILRMSSILAFLSLIVNKYFQSRRILSGKSVSEHILLNSINRQGINPGLIWNHCLQLELTIILASLVPLVVLYSLKPKCEQGLSLWDEISNKSQNTYKCCEWTGSKSCL